MFELLAGAKTRLSVAIPAFGLPENVIWLEIISNTDADHARSLAVLVAGPAELFLPGVRGTALEKLLAPGHPGDLSGDLQYERTQDGPPGYFGVYFWNGDAWQLDDVYPSKARARKAQARLRAGLLPSN